MNDDTPTLESAYDEAEAELTSQEQPSESEDTQEETEQPEVEQEKPQEEAKEEETFAEKPDLTGKTPEELEQIYKNWQSSYTKKRQAEKQELEELRQQLQELKSKVEPEFQPLTPQQIAQLPPEQQVEYLRREAQQEAEIASQNSYIEAQEDAFYKSDPRLDENNPEFDPDLHDLVIMRLANARDEWEAQGKPITEFDFLGKAKEYIKAFDNRISSSNKKYIQQQSKIARTKTSDFAKQVPQTSGAKAKQKNMDLDEALEAAMNG